MFWSSPLALFWEGDKLQPMPRAKVFKSPNIRRFNKMKKRKIDVETYLLIKVNNIKVSKLQIYTILFTYFIQFYTILLH